MVPIEIHPAETGMILPNIAQAICIWDVRCFDDDGAFGRMPDGWYKEQYPFVEYVILMTFTGGKNYNEWCSLDENGSLCYDFSTPLRILKNVLRQGVRPIIVIGNVPYALSDPSKIEPDSYGWGNRLPPKDFREYYEYISSFARMIADHFTVEEYSRWQFRVGTEPDNFHWWTGTEEEYCQLYDYTVAALQNVLGAEHLDVSPGNLETYTKWPALLAHCAIGKNYYTGQTGTQADRFSISHYELGAESQPYWELENILSEALRRAKEYPQLGITAINIGEGQFLSDGMKPPHRLSNAQDGTEYGASWMAATYDTCCSNGCEYFANWAYHCDFWLTDKPMLKVPAFHVAQMIKNMSGSRRAAVRSGRAEKNGNTVGAVASYDPSSQYLQILIYNHNIERENIAEDLEIRIIPDDIPINRISAEAWLVDEDHSNFFRTWLKDSADIPRTESSADFDTLGSLVDTEVAALLKDEDLDFWTAQKEKYRHLDGLQKIPLSFSEEDHVIRIPFTLNGHGVLFLAVTL